MSYELPLEGDTLKSNLFTQLAIDELISPKGYLYATFHLNPLDGVWSFVMSEWVSEAVNGIRILI